MSLRPPFLGLALALFTLACGGGGSKTQAIPAPGNVRATLTSSQVTVTWTPPATPVDGYDLEGRAQAQSFTQINDTLIPSSYNAALVSFQGPPPELNVLEFRMRSKAGSAYSDYSNTASLQTPLAPPATLQASATAGMVAVKLDWLQNSALATRILLERATADGNAQPASPWTQVANLPAASGSFTDTQVLESVTYLYRASNTLDSTTSASVLSGAATVHPVAPQAFTAVPGVATVDLSWTNLSRTATAIQITRSPAAAAGSNVLATLSPSATSYRDGSLRPGVYSYGIQITDGIQTVQGATVQTTTLNPPGAPLFKATLLANVPADLSTAVLAPAGNWITGANGFGSLAVHAPAGAAWTPWATSDAVLVGSRFLAVDPQGAPHVVYGTRPTAANLPGALVHAWFNGVAWSSEKVTDYDGSGLGAGPSAIVDGAGIVKFTASGGSGAQLNYLRYFSREGGAWTSAGLGDSLDNISLVVNSQFGLDLAGRPHLLATYSASFLDISRLNDGTWTSQQVMDPDFAAPLAGTCLWVDNDTAWYFFEKITYATPGYAQFRVKAKVGGVWQPSILLDAFDRFPTYAAALSPDGSRLALAIIADRGPLVYQLTAQGWVGSPLPAASNTQPFLRAGFDASGRLHLLLQVAQTTDWHE